MPSNMKLEDWLDDLCARFIINLPAEDLSSVARICFQVEEAQWFYEDFIRPLDAHLPPMSLRQFCLRIFQHCPLLSRFSQESQMAAFDEFLKYKERIPVRGAIMLNQEMDSAVLVKGWKKGASWSFPRGKINKDEDDLDCAIRELWEETGYDVRAGHLILDDDHLGQPLDVILREQHLRFYVFRGVPMDTSFEPKTRKEISKIQWYRLSDLPGYKQKKGKQHHSVVATVNVNKFYMVAKFLPMLERWINLERAREARRTVGMPPITSSLHQEPLTVEEGAADVDYAAYVSESAAEVDGPLDSHVVESNLKGTEDALKALLKIQPLLEQAHDNIQSHSLSQDKGDALLALLRPSVQRESLSLRPSQTLPTEPSTAGMGTYPSFEQPASYIPPQSSTPIQAYNGSYRSEHLQQFPDQNNHYPTQQQKTPYLEHSHHSQHTSAFLQHPQPLPPQIQRNVFSGTLPHTSVEPQNFKTQNAPPLQFGHPEQNHSLVPIVPDRHYYGMPPRKQVADFHQQLPQTSDRPMHQPMHQPMQGNAQYSTSASMAQPKLPLTQHTLSLLDAFKAPSSMAPGLEKSQEHPHHQPMHKSPQPEPADLQPLQSTLVDRERAFRPSNMENTLHNQDHVNRLLGMFRSPDATNAMPLPKFPQETSSTNDASPNVASLVNPTLRPTSAASPLPSSTTTKPVNQILLSLFKSSKISESAPVHTEQSSEIPPVALFSGPSTASPVSVYSKDSGSQARTSRHEPQFRPSAILKRPNQTQGHVHSLQPQLGAVELSASPLPYDVAQSRTSSTTTDSSYRRQILKRSPIPTESALPNLSALSETAKHSKPVPQPLNVKGGSSHQESAPAQKQTLLSLFGSPSPAYRLQNSPNLPLPSYTPSASSVPKSRVSSLAGQGSQRRLSSANNKTDDENFLLGFLGEQVANGKR